MYNWTYGGIPACNERTEPLEILHYHTNASNAHINPHSTCALHFATLPTLEIYPEQLTCVLNGEWTRLLGRIPKLQPVSPASPFTTKYPCRSNPRSDLWQNTELLSKPLLTLNAIQHLRFPIAFSTFGILRIWGYRSIVLYTWALTVFFMWLLLHPQCMRSCYCHCC